MRKTLLAVVTFVLIFTHLIPPSNIIFASEEVNHCENMSFTVNNIRENDVIISGTAESSENIEIEFQAKNTSELVSVDDNGNFILNIEDELLESNDVITISNDYFIIETEVMPRDSEDMSIQSTQYVECPVNEDNVEESTDNEISEEENKEQLSKEDLSNIEDAAAVFENESRLLINEFEAHINNINENNNPGNITPFASLSEVQLLTDVVIDANLTPDVEQPPESQQYNLNLNLNGIGLADTELTSPNRVVVFYAPDLAGKLIHSGGTANVQVDILPLTMDDLPVLNTALEGLQGTLTGLVTGLISGINDALPLLIPPSLVEINGLDELNTAINNLNNLNTALANVLSYTDSVQYTVNDDGTIIVDFSDGLGNHLETAVTDIVQAALDDVNTAVNNLEINILSLLPIVGDLLSSLTNSLLVPLIGNVTGAVNTLGTSLTNGVIDLTNDLASAQVIGDTNISLDVLVNNPPGDVEGTVPVLGAGIQSSVIDLALLNSMQSQDTISFPNIEPILNTAEIEGNSTDGYRIYGTGEESGDTVYVINDAGAVVGTGLLEEDGTYSFILDRDISPNKILTVQAVDEAGNESNTLEVTVPADITRIESVPDIIFNTTTITDGETLVLRQSENNSVQIIDTRQEGDWQLSAGANSLDNGNGDSLSNALIYIKKNGEEVSLENGAVEVASNEESSSSELIDTISWSDNEGVLLKLNPIFAQADTEYSTTINWTLTDGP